MVYTSDGSTLWDADVAGAAEAIAVAQGTGDDEGARTVNCAAATGYVSAYHGKTGARKWSAFLGEPAEFLAPYGRDGLVAVARSGLAIVLDETGRLVGGHDLGSPITALLQPGGQRATNAILLGTEDGQVLALPDASGR